MDIKELIKARHSVRKFKDIPVNDEHRAALDKLAKELSEKSGLKIQVIYDDPECFKSIFAYGRFKNAANYIALAGDKTVENIDEKCGYYGQQMVLKAQEIGLNTCWIGG